MSNDSQYADRDAMWLDQQGGHYIRHVDHMTREGLHSKSDIAAELGWRDLQIQELTQQLSAKIISEQNIINAFGIKGEGAHSKLVIEYVHGLVTENARMREAIEFATAPDMWQEQHDGMLDYRYVDWYVDVLNAALEPNSTDAAIAEIKAQGVDEFARTFNSETIEGSSMVMVAKTFAANLRAGRKG